MAEGHQVQFGLAPERQEVVAVLAPLLIYLAEATTCCLCQPQPQPLHLLQHLWVILPAAQIPAGEMVCFP